MRCTLSTASPVITLLSPSFISSRKAQSLLAAIGGLKNVAFEVSQQDQLNLSFKSSIPGFSRKWDSLVSKCPVSGSHIHFLSMCSNSTSRREKHISGKFSLIGISGTTSERPGVESIQIFRDLLALHISSMSSVLKLKNSIGKITTAEELLRSVSTGGLPILDIPPSISPVDIMDNKSVTNGLKEVVIPYFDNALYTDGSTILSNIASANLTRPTVGVYKWSDSSTHIRPLPSAGEDQKLPPPSFVFQHEDPENIHDSLVQLGVTSARIGYGGTGNGQVMILHRDLAGLDIRYCKRKKFSSAFAEAQESLLAGSLEELQSTNTLLAGGESGKDDHRIGKADCWIEVRANLKQPSGFWRRSTPTNPTTRRIAKAPDIPYE